MHKILARMGVVLGLTLSWVDSGYALDSYRFLHVTIETPWSIFIFLLFTVLAPFILMAILVWRYTERKAELEKQASDKEGRE
ncbi:MAG: hypothetical protein HY306_00855 [Nitrosomonadales bacterium]|nr:hypothetical protein [Nitrosomonadales bacterium]